MAKITSLSSLGWAHYTLYEALPKIAARGFKRVEIASFSTYCFHFNFGSPNPAELKKMFDFYDMTPVCLNYSCGSHKAWLPEEIEKHEHELTKKIVQLEEVGIPMMTMDFGLRNDRQDQEYQLSNAVKAYNRLGEIALKHNVRMLLEVPHLYGITNRPEQVLWVFDRLESENIGVLVDSSHWGIIGYDIDEFFSTLAIVSGIYIFVILKVLILRTGNRNLNLPPAQVLWIS